MVSLRVTFWGVFFNSVLVFVPFTLIRREDGTFRKPLSNRVNLITPSFRFRVNRTHFEMDLFKNDGFTLIV